jgi:hypothetical protein
MRLIGIFVYFFIFVLTFVIRFEGLKTRFILHWMLMSVLELVDISNIRKIFLIYKFSLF